MKQLTEAQVAAFLCAVVPPNRKLRRDAEHQLTAAECQAAQTNTAIRRAIDGHHERRRLRLEMEL